MLKGNNHVKRVGTFSLNPRLQGREEGPATPMASDLINYVCNGAILKTKRMRFGELPGQRTRMQPRATMLGPELHSDRSSRDPRAQGEAITGETPQGAVRTLFLYGNKALSHGRKEENPVTVTLPVTDEEKQGNKTLTQPVRRTKHSLRPLEFSSRGGSGRKLLLKTLKFTRPNSSATCRDRITEKALP